MSSENRLADDNRQLAANLTRVQTRCTELLLENRRLRGELKAAQAAAEFRARRWAEAEQLAAGAVDALSVVYATRSEANAVGSEGTHVSVPGNAWDVIVQDRDRWKREALRLAGEKESGR